MKKCRDESVRYLVVCWKCKTAWACTQMNGKTRFCNECIQNKIACKYAKTKVEMSITPTITAECPICYGKWHD